MDWWLLQTVLSNPFPSSDTESSKPLSCKAKDIVTVVLAYRTALEIKLLLTCETKAPSRDNCETGISFCKINSFRFRTYDFCAVIQRRCHCLQVYQLVLRLRIFHTPKIAHTAHIVFHTGNMLSHCGGGFPRLGIVAGLQHFVIAF